VACSSAQLNNLAENNGDGGADSEVIGQNEKGKAKPYTRKSGAIASGMRDWGGVCRRRHIHK
jgi:hypothetical protein